MEKINVRLKRLADNVYTDAVIEEDYADGVTVLRIDIGGETLTGEDDDYFTAFGKLRDSLLEKGFGLCCAGAMLNAGQSGMMAGSDMVYLVRKGEKPTLSDRVWIFEEKEPDSFPDSEAQRKFFEEWLNSI